MSGPKKKPALDGIVFDDPADPELSNLLDTAPSAPAADANHADLLDAPATTPAPAGQPLPNQRPMKLMQADATDDRSELEKYASAFASTYGTRPEDLPAAAGQTLADDATMLGQGVTFDHGDEMAAAWTPENGGYDTHQLASGKEQLDQDRMDIPKHYAAGSARKDLRNSIRKGIDEAHANSPYTGNEAKLVGNAATSALAGLALPETAAVGALGRIGTGILAGAAGGNVASMGASTHDFDTDPEGLAADADKGALIGGVGGGLLSTAAEVPGAFRAAAPFLRGASNEARTSAVGKGAGFGNVARENGLDFAEEGMGERAAELFPHSIPKNAKWYAEQSGAMRDDVGKQLGELVDDVSANEVPQAVSLSDFMTKVRGLRDSYAGKISEQAKSNARTVERLAKNIYAKYGTQEYLSPADLNSIKRDLSEVGFPAKANAAMPSGQKQIVSQKMSRVPRGELSEVMSGENPDYPHAMDESGRKFNDLNETYGDLETINGMSTEKAIADARHEPRGWAQWIPGAHDMSTRADDARAMALSGASNAAEAGGRFSDAAAAGPSSRTAAANEAGATYGKSARSDGTDDPVWGQTLSGLPQDDRDTRYMILMQTDPEFRQRQRERSQQQSQSTQ